MNPADADRHRTGADLAGTSTPTAAGGDVTVSVIITNYNYARFLAAAIRSVLGQTHAAVECIVVDDGSSDDSLEVARGFADVTVVAKPNGGQVSAAKAAIDHARGEMILFLDSDDALHPDACGTIAAAYAPDITLYQGALDIVDVAGRRIGAYPDAPLLSARQREHVLRHGFIPSSPTSGNAFAASHVRRMLAEATDDMRYFVDGYLIYSAPFFGRVRLLDATLGRYLVHGGNVSLSAGVNRRSAEKSLRNAIWQRSGITTAQRLTGQRAGDRTEHLTAWQLRHLLILRRCYGVADIAPNLSDGRAAWRAMRRFASYPGISTAQRLKNMGLIAALFAGHRGIGRRVVPALA